MESQLVSDLKAELDASRRQNEHICMQFEVYRKATQVKLSELRQHKRMLERKVIALREKLGASDGNEKTTAAQDEKKNGRHPSTNDNDATPLKSIEEETHAQDHDAHEIDIQWDSSLLDSEIAAAIESYDSETAASIDSYGEGPKTPSTILTAPIDGSHRHQPNKDDQRHQQNGDPQQQLHETNSNNTNNQDPSRDPFKQDPARSPLAFGGRSGERHSSLKRSNPRSKTTVLRQRMLLLRHASRCSAPDGTCTYSKHCADMRRACKHIATGCSDPTCGVKHCLTSRYVLNHYQCRKTDRLPSIDDCGIKEGPPRKKRKES